jgi:hypothetical protein
VTSPRSVVVELGGVLVMIRRIVTAVGISIALLMGLATPASAHDVQIYHGANAAWVWSHNSVEVWDQICTAGKPVFTQYYVSTIGGSVLYRLDAPCGGTGRRNHYPQQVTMFRLCETTVGCSGWKYT